MPQPTSRIAAWAPSPQHALEQQQAAARRAVMAGAEGERGFDLDGEVVRFDAGAIMRAVNEEAAGANRRKAGQGVGDPIALRRAAEHDPFDGLSAGCRRDEVAKRVLVRRKAEIGLDDPVARAPMRRFVRKSARRGFGRFEAFDDQIDDGAGAALVADEAQKMSGVVGRKTFKH